MEIQEVKIMSKKLKLIILFIDFIIFAILSDILLAVLSQIGIDIFNTWLFLFLVYLVFFVIPELFFNQTLGMKFFRVFIVNKDSDKFRKAFFKYSFLVILDRFLLFYLFYFFKFLLSKDSLLISEKYSGLRWGK